MASATTDLVDFWRCDHRGSRQGNDTVRTSVDTLWHGDIGGMLQTPGWATTSAINLWALNEQISRWQSRSQPAQTEPPVRIRCTAWAATRCLSRDNAEIGLSRVRAAAPMWFARV